MGKGRTVYNGFKVAAIIPFRNEAAHIGQVIEGIPDFVDFIIAVDDASTDGGLSIVDNHRVIKLTNSSSRGVGGAIMEGHLTAKRLGSQVDIVMAGDGQMDPAYLPSFLDEIAIGFDYVKANRFLKASHRDGMPLNRVIGNRILGLLTKIASGYLWISDPQNGYTAIRTSILDRMELKHIWPGYQFENDMLIHLNLIGAKIRELPIPARYGTEKSGIRLPSFIPFTFLFLVQRAFWRLWMKPRAKPLNQSSELYPPCYWDIVELDGTKATRTVLKWFAPSKGDRILDVGCGTGRYMAAFEKAGAEVVGIEPFSFPLAQARKRVKGELRQMSAENMLFPDASFDKVLFYHVIEHLEHPHVALNEIHRVLKDKGRLLLAFPNSNYLLFKLGLVKQSPQHLHRFTPSFNPTGFKVLEKKVFRFGFNVVMLLERET